MFSIKDTLRKTIITTSALAVFATSFFTGCSKNVEVSNSDLYPTTSEATTQYTDDINPGDKDTNHDANTFSIKYKYWYDNPDVKEAQDKTLTENDPGGDNPNGETFLGLAGLPLYTDHSGNQYIISGRTICYLAEGKLASKDMYQRLRTTGTGERIYVDMIDSLAMSVQEFAEKIAKLEKTQPETYNDRLASSDTEETISGKEYAVYLNNANTGSTFSSANKWLGVSAMLSGMDVGRTVILDKDTAEVYLFTAAGEVKVTFTINKDICTVSYSTGEQEQTISSDELNIVDENLFLSLAVIEDYLGYDIEYYDDFINIITDNKDIIKPENVVSSEAKADPTLDNNDTAKPADDPANVDAKEELIKDQEQAEKEAEDKAIEEITGLPVDEMTQEDYDTFGITPPGEDPDTYKPSTDSDGKTVAQRRDEAINKADEEIKNGTCGWDEENIEASKDILRKRLEDLGWSQEKIEEALNS